MKKLLSIIISLTILFAVCVNVYAATPIIDNAFEITDTQGRPVPGGFVYTYEPGTTTPKVTYSDEAGTIPHPNPVQLDSSGKEMIYGSGSFTIDVKDLFGSQVPGFPKVINANIEPDDVTEISIGIVNTFNFDSISALRDFPNDGAIVYEAVTVAGYYGTGTGGGGQFYWDATSTETDNGGTIIKASATETGRWLRENGPHISVKVFGVKDEREDALFDSGPAFQETIDYCEDNLLAAYVPSGIYNIGQTLNLNGNDATLIGESMDTVFLQFTSAVTGPMIDVNPGGATRRYRGRISELKLIGAVEGTDTTWYNNTFYASSGIEVENVVNGLIIDRVRVLKTNDSGISFSGAGSVSNTWFNTIKDCFVEQCKGDGYILEANSNGVKLSGNRAYLCNVGYDIRDSFAIEMTGCGSEDTNSEGMLLKSVGGFNVSGSWFEDHGVVVSTAGAIGIDGVSGDPTRPATGTISGCLFNSAGLYALNCTNAKVNITGCKALNNTLNGVIVNSDCEINEKSNLWDVTGAQFSGTGVPEGLIDYDGLWVPVISDASTGGNTASYTTNATYQKYFKRGNKITIQAMLENIDTSGMTAGNILFIQGLPLAASATDFMIGSCQLSEVTFSGAWVVPTIAGSGSTQAMYMAITSIGSTITSVKVSDITSGTADIIISLTYTI